MESQEIDFKKTLLPWFSQTVKIADYAIADRFNAAGIELTKVQWLLLRRLERSDGLPQHNLAFLTNRHTASLARLITTMEKKNLVARIPSRDDHRINLIHITTHGERILKEAFPIVKDFLDEMQRGISDEKLQQVIEIIERIHKNLNVEPFETMKTNS
jgi:DNA-binding MarR family transcriptional regulator